LNQQYGLFGIIGPFIASILLFGSGVGAASLLRSHYSNQEIATIGSFIFALIAFAIGAYATFICCLLST
jgi:hypothetical protein